jgi:hypothetical protein
MGNPGKISLLKWLGLSLSLLSLSIAVGLGGYLVGKREASTGTPTITSTYTPIAPPSPPAAYSTPYIYTSYTPTVPPSVIPMVTWTPIPTPTNAPTATPSATPTVVWTSTPTKMLPQAMVVVSALNVRSGPGVEYPVIDVASAGKVFDVVGTIPCRNWLQVITADGGFGWISNKPAYISVFGSMDSIPLVQPAPPKPPINETPIAPGQAYPEIPSPTRAIVSQ